MSPIYIVTFSLLLFPLLGLVLGYLTRNNPLVRRCIISPIFVIAIVAIIAGILGFSTTNTSVDLILYSSLYLSVSLIMWYIYFKKSRILAALFMLIIYGCGYLFSLVLPLTGDLMPKVVLKLDEQTIYKETILSSKYRAKQVEIYKVYSNFLEKRVQAKVYYDESPAFVDETLSIDYKPKEGHLILSMPDDNSNYLYTFHKRFNVNWRDTIYIK